MNKSENKVLNFIQKNMIIIFPIIVFILGLFIRIKFINIEEHNMSFYYLKWFDRIKTNGGLFALKDVYDVYDCDYTQPYLTIYALLSYIPNINAKYAIKSVSIIFDTLISIFSGKIYYLVKHEDKNSKELSIFVSCLVFMLPTIILNSSWWGQCDSIYSAFVFISLFYFLKEDYAKSFIFLGIALSFKLQFIFILPMYIIYYFKEKKFSILYFLLIPISCFIMNVPGILFGHPISHCFSVYWGQITEYTYQMVFNIFNIYYLIPNVEGISYLCFIVLIFIFGSILLFSCMTNKNLKQNDVLSLSLLSILLCVFFLPCMHERYLYLADILSVIYAAINRNKIIYPIVINSVSFFSYSLTLFGKSFYLSDAILPIAFLMIIIDLFIFYYNEVLKNEKKSV